MDGESRMTAAERKDLGGTPRRCHQHDFLLKVQHRPHDSAGQRGLAGSCRTTEYHHRVGITAGHELAEHIDSRSLLASRLKAETLPYPIIQFAAYHSAKIQKNVHRVAATLSFNKNKEKIPYSSFIILHF